MPTPVYLEVGRRRVFAAALDWPGWCRSGGDEEAALQALAAYAPRYAVAAQHAGYRLPVGAASSFQVVERLPGTATTEFGAPGVIPVSDSRPLKRDGAKRMGALVRASWTVLADVVAQAPPELRRGPRGGGRDRDKIVDHVLGAEAAYARKLGVKHRQPALDDADGIASLRAAILGAMLLPSDRASPVPRGWPVGYAARRIAWHALDHAWEIEDRSRPV